MSDINESKEMARLLMGGAISFHYAAEKIANQNWSDHGGRSFEPWPPFFANIGYAFELSLKAFIVYRGGTEHEIKDQIRHDLAKALQRAQELGLNKLNDPIVELIGKIRMHHKSRDFFYLRQTNVENLPKLEDALAASTDLLKTVATQLPIDDFV